MRVLEGAKFTSCSKANVLSGQTGSENKTFRSSVCEHSLTFSLSLCMLSFLIKLSEKIRTKKVLHRSSDCSIVKGNLILNFDCP